MKILLDENLPTKLKYRFIEAGFETFTVRDYKWQSKQNGELISLMLENDFTTLITVDANLSYQQNLSKYPIQLVILFVRQNAYEIFMEFIEEVFKQLKVNSSNLISISHPNFE